MLDLKYVRQHQQEIEQNVGRRRAKADVAHILDLDAQRSRRLTKLEQDRASLKQASKSKPDQATITKLRQLGEEIRVQEVELRQIESSLQTAASFLPNLSSPDMPVGRGEEDNVDIAAWVPGHGDVDSAKLGLSGHIAYDDVLPTHRFEDGAPLAKAGEPEYQRRHHLDIGESLGIIDMAQGAKVAGTRFAYLLGAAVELENAVVQLLATKLLSRGFMWVDPPLMVQEAALFGTSHFPEGRDQVYQVASEHVEDGRDLYLVGSSEPSLFAYGMDRVFEEAQLPLKMFAVTSCFRSEVGSWGKDVRGIKRVHQFNKLEMDVICTPDSAESIFEELVGYNTWLLQQLELPYRVVNKCTGDCGYLATYKQYDVEVWMPSQQEFMETMTDTWATDFQARRLNLRYESAPGQRQLAHTVNDTGAALGRILAAILDNYQQADGSVKVPAALRPWVSTDTVQPNKLATSTKR